MIYTLSISGLFKMVLYLLLFYFLAKILLRVFAPYLFKYAAKKAEQKFGQQFGGFQQNKTKQKQQKAGETIIDKMPEQNKTSNKNIGEYIDYEEVD